MELEKERHHAALVEVADLLAGRAIEHHQRHLAFARVRAWAGGDGEQRAPVVKGP